MPFEERLRLLCKRARSIASTQLVQTFQSIGRVAAVTVRSGNWDQLPVKGLDKLNEAAESARYATEVLDAVEYINKYLLSARNRQLYDLKVSGRSFAQVQSDIRHRFDSRQVPLRGFVYLAWTSKPEFYSYVGKAKTSKRLNLSGHGKLAHALNKVSTLSLLFPQTSEEHVLFRIEASLILVIEYQWKSRPKLNDKDEHVPEGSASEELLRFADFFRRLSDAVDPFEGKPMS